MNTSDRSIAGMDLAVRRRFAFVTLPPDRTAVAAQGLPLATEVFDRLMDVFVEHAPDDALDLLPGHAYFLAQDEEELRERFPALAALDVRIEVAPGPEGVAIRLVPGGRAGAVPLRSAQTGQVAGGFLVRPRFGWAGIGSVLRETGWHTAPEFLSLPLVPGSGREIPPWVLAGPVLARLEALLRSLRRGYHEVETLLRRPRGRILWDRYLAESLLHGRWDRLPCRFPDLDADPKLRREVRWTVERLHRDLATVGGTNPVAAALAALASRLLEELADVMPLLPRRQGLRQDPGAGRLFDEAVRRGVEAMAWVVEERGLGGGRELDGLAWTLPLDRPGKATSRRRSAGKPPSPAGR